MGIFETIFLGILQGLTEFLPVSSSGHLVIAQSLLKDFKEPALTYDILLHFATFCAVVVHFRYKIFTLIKAFIGFFNTKHRVVYYDNRKFLWGIIVASIPTAVIGLFLKKYTDTIFSSTVYAGYGLIITSILLIVSDKFNGRKSISIPESFWIGIVQGIAVIPGISRSGSTISAALMLGIKREEAVEFSFLMALPAVFGATLLEVRKISSIETDMLLIYLLGCISAFITALFAIHIVRKIVNNKMLKYFSLYCLIVGIITVIWL
ncbi:MAG: undecaprenyl-diphosphate phosphatase [Deferribacterales bacterium]